MVHPSQYRKKQRSGDYYRGALIVMMAAACAAPAVAQMQNLSEAWRPDDSFQVYAVTINYPKPFDRPTSLYGVYLGHGSVLTAAHVVGRRNWLLNPVVRIAAHELSAKVLKQGSFGRIDLALLSLDEMEVPLKLRMRRDMQLCATIPKIGADVIVAYPDRTVTRTLSLRLSSITWPLERNSIP